MTEYELYHHGILGQKWGVRRTAAQLGHLAARKIATGASKTGKAASKAASKTTKAIGKQASKAKKAVVAKAKQDVKEQKEKNYYKKLKKKKLSDMTEKEISDLTKRLKAETSLKDAKYEERIVNARKFYNNVAKQPINSFATTFATQTAQKMVNSMWDDKKSDSKESGESKPAKKLKAVKQKPKRKEEIVEFEVDVPKASTKKPKSSADSSKAFDDYFESEVAKERERKKRG